MALHRDHVGQRVVVRRFLRGQTGPTGGPAFTDVLGVLEQWSPSELAVRHEDGRLHRIAQADVATAKPVPPRTSVRHRIEPDRLQRICNAGWRAPHEEEVGDWLLRAGAGFTGRANSALVVGDPASGVAEAVGRIEAFYAAHGQRAVAQVVVGGPWLPVLTELGWTTARPDQPDALVQVASVAQARRAAAASDRVAEVEVSETLSDDWLARYGRTEGLDPAAVRAVLTSGDSVAFASVGQPAGAIGRGVVTGDWLGIAAVEVAPPLRRTGLARAVVDALLEWAAARGALSAYLQTLPDNVPALELYARYGFRTHHAYRYLAAPE